MKVSELARKLNAEIVNMPNPDDEVEGGYCGDFLSFVMQRAPENCAWFTVMTNVNVAAVASLTGAKAVVVCENCQCDDNLIDKVKKQGICVLKTNLDIYNAVKTYIE